MILVKKLHYFVAILSLVFLWLAVGCSNKESSNTQKTEESTRLDPAVWINPVQRGTLQETVTGTGTLEGWEDIQMLAKVSGTVTEVHLRLGDIVEKDSIILEIEPEVQELQLAQAEAALLQAEAAYETSQSDLTRYEALYKKNDISEMEIEAIRAAAKNSQGMLNSATAAVALAKRMVADSRISSPIDGYLAALDVDEGDLVSTGTPICRVVKIRPLKLRLGLTEAEIIRVKTGQIVRIIPDTFPTMEIIGRVNRLGVAADLQSRLFPVEIKISDAPESIKPGMVARAQIVLKEHRDVIIIHQQALVETKEGQIVYVVEGNTARSVAVTLGVKDITNIVVTSGLDEGDQLVIRGQQVLQDSITVRIETPKNAL